MIEEPLLSKLARYQEALMDMVNQHCQEDGLYATMALSSNENALDLLEEDGLAERVGGHLLRYRLLWDNLDKDRL